MVAILYTSFSSMGKENHTASNDIIATYNHNSDDSVEIFEIWHREIQNNYGTKFTTALVLVMLYDSLQFINKIIFNHTTKKFTDNVTKPIQLWVFMHLQIDIYSKVVDHQHQFHHFQ